MLAIPGRVGCGLIVLGVLLLWPGRADAAQITVCNSGCTRNNTQLQLALDDAVFGDEVLLQTNFVYAGQFVLKAKTCAPNNDTCYITVRTGVTATGTIMSSSSFPAANIRITPSYSSVLAKIRSTSATVPAIQSEFPPAATPKYWRLKWLEFNTLTNASNTAAMVQFGTTDVAMTSKTMLPSNIQVIQCFFKGDPIQGQHRALIMMAHNTLTRDSYFKDIKSLSEGQVWWTTSGDTHLVTNNYMEGGTETFFTGGSTGCCTQLVTITGGATTAGATLSAVTDLIVGQWISVEIGGVEYSTKVASIAGNVVTWSPVLQTTPDVPGEVRWGHIPSNLTVTKNHLTRPVTWRDPIVATPQNLQITASTGTGGTLAVGTYAYRVVARMPTVTGTVARSTASAEASCVIDTGSGSCIISWNAVANATQYYIYGRNAGGQNIRFSVTAPTVTFTDTGAAGTTEVVPTSTGSIWLVKNTLEIKYGKGFLIEGNIIEHSWVSGQSGTLVLLTVASATGLNRSATIEDVTFRNNIVRHGAQAMLISCRDLSSAHVSSGTAGNQTYTNNLFYDINATAWGASAAQMFMWSTNPYGLVPGTNAGCHGNNSFEHNTIDSTNNSSFLYFNLWRDGIQHTLSNFTYRNNLTVKVTYGIAGNNSCVFGADCWTKGTSGTSTFARNVVADQTCSLLPNAGDQFCPTYATLLTSYTNPALRNYRLLAPSPYKNGATDGTDIGVNQDTIEALTNIALTGDDTGTPPPVPPVVTTVSLPNGIQGVLYSQTLTATGGTTPYTWAVTTGVLPAGLTLVSSTGVISGTPTVAGSEAFTVSVTGAGASSTRDLSVIVTTPISEAVMPRKFATYMERPTLARDVCPDGTDASDTPIQRGTLCYDMTAGALMVATATAPAVVWSPIGGAGAEYLNITLRADGLNYPMTDLTAGGTEINSSRSHRARVPLSTYDECRLVIKVVVAGVTGVVRWTYDTDNLGEDTTYTEVAGSDVPLSALGLIAGPWTAIPAPAKIDDVFIGNRAVNGNGSEDPAVSNVYFQCRKVVP